MLFYFSCTVFLSRQFQKRCTPGGVESMVRDHSVVCRTLPCVTWCDMM